jgi:Nucleotidyltransferase/Ring hydroxylating alpha subunit (catalytic domain)
MESAAGAIICEADRRGLLGTKLIVVGTNAIAAYHIEAAGMIREMPQETQDCDLAWTGAQVEEGRQPIWDMLKAVDATFTINTERSFQARNAKAYEVEILAAPSRIGSIFRTDRPMPIPLPEQEWLLHGRFVDHVVVCHDGQPARIVAPDPRWFALQKLWMADQPKRNALKRPKDRKQATMLLDAIAHPRLRQRLPPSRQPAVSGQGKYRDGEGKLNLPDGISPRLLFQNLIREELTGKDYDVSGLSDTQMTCYNYWLFFPNVFIQVGVGDATIIINEPHPSGDHNMFIWHQVYLHWHPESERAAKIEPVKVMPPGEHYFVHWVMEQDYVQMPIQYQGRRNPLYKEMILTKSEPRAAYFHTMLDKVMA